MKVTQTVRVLAGAFGICAWVSAQANDVVAPDKLAPFQANPPIMADTPMPLPTQEVPAVTPTVEAPPSAAVKRKHRASVAEQPRRKPTDGSPDVIERVEFRRAPLLVQVSSTKERRIYLPWESALHLPPEAAGLHAQIIGTTLYLSASHSQEPVRLVVEGLEGQGMIPLDVRITDEEISDEMEIVSSLSQRRTPTGTREADAEREPDAPDLVQLTRYCSQQVYAPQRLIKPLPGVRRVNFAARPVAGLYRGGLLQTTPIGAWRSAQHHITAVRFTNRSSTPIELDMDMLRGHWLAATPQHYGLGPAGAEDDTTAVCLISIQSFEAARP